MKEPKEVCKTLQMDINNTDIYLYMGGVKVPVIHCELQVDRDPASMQSGIHFVGGAPYNLHPVVTKTTLRLELDVTNVEIG